MTLPQIHQRGDLWLIYWQERLEIPEPMEVFKQTGMLYYGDMRRLEFDEWLYRTGYQELSEYRPYIQMRTENGFVYNILNPQA